MSFPKFLLSNVLGIAFVALIGLLLGSLAEWFVGLFVHNSLPSFLKLAIIIAALLGVPGIFRSNWLSYKAAKEMEARLSNDSIEEQEC